MYHRNHFIARGEGRRRGTSNRVLYDLPLSSVGAPGALDRMGWSPLDELPAGSIVLDVRDGDPITGGGTTLTPAVGPVFTKTGSPQTGKSTPWVGRDGAPITAMRVALNQHWVAASAIPILDGLDAVILMLCRSRGTAGRYPLINYVATRGWYAGSELGTWRLAGASATKIVNVPAGVPIAPGWELLALTLDRATVRGTAYLNGVAGTPLDLTGMGSLEGGAQVLQLGALISEWSSIVRIVVAQRASLASITTTAWHQRLAADALGLRAQQGVQPATYARASLRCGYPDGPTGGVRILSSHCPPVGSASPQSDAAIVSVTSKNHGFVTGDGAAYVTDVDVGLVVGANPIDDAAALAALCPDLDKVISITNPTAGPLVARLGNAIGGAPVTSWESIRCRVAAGGAGVGTPRHGWSTAGGAYTNGGNCAASYARSAAVGTPAANTDKQAIEIPAKNGAVDTVVYIVLWCAGQGGVVEDEVPSLAAAGASSTVVQGVITTTHTPSDASETVEHTCTPRLWGGAMPAAAETIVSRSGGATGIIATDGAGHVTTTDGTNTPSAAITEADGIEETIRVAHGSGRLYATQVGGTGAETAYDGALAQSGTLTLRGSRRGYGRLRVLRAPRFRSTT